MLYLVVSVSRAKPVPDFTLISRTGGNSRSTVTVLAVVSSEEGSPAFGAALPVASHRERSSHVRANVCFVFGMTHISRSQLIQ